MTIQNILLAPVTASDVHATDFSLHYENGCLVEVYFWISDVLYFDMPIASFEKTELFIEELASIIECPENLDIEEDVEEYLDYVTAWHTSEETRAMSDERVCEIAACVANFFPEYKKLK